LGRRLLRAAGMGRIPMFSPWRGVWFWVICGIA